MRKCVRGFPRYKITTAGVIQHEWHHNPIRVTKQGTVVLYHLGHPRCVTVADLMLTTFDSDPQPGQRAKHKNGKPTDNRIGNLCWWPLKDWDLTVSGRTEKFNTARYTIHDDGTITDDSEHKPVEPIKDKWGRLSVRLIQGRTIPQFDLADLILDTFGPRLPRLGAHAGHSDDNKANNRIDNLYWELSI